MTDTNTLERPKLTKKSIDHCDWCSRLATDCSRFFGHNVCQKCQIEFKTVRQAKEARK